MKTKNLKKIIQNNQLFKSDNLFQGAGLIISEKEIETKDQKYVYVISEYAYYYSWLIFELKKIYYNEIDFLNKYEFFPLIGKTINEAINHNLPLKDSLLFTLENVEEIVDNLS
jgi:hypothetical protein